VLGGAERVPQRIQKRVGPLDVGDVAGVVDHVQRPAEPGARSLGQAERDETVVPARQQRDRDSDAAELGVRDLLRPGLDQLPHGPLDVRNPRTASGIRAEGVQPLRVLPPGLVEIEERPAIESLRVALGGAQSEPDCHDAESERHAVPADPRRSVDHQPAHEIAMRDCEPRGEAAVQGVRDHGGLLLARRAEQLAEPVGECHVGQAGDRLGLPQTGNIGDDDAVALGKPGDHGRPVHAAALDPAVQQDERRAFATLQHCGGRAGQVQPSCRDRDPGQQPLPSVLAGEMRSALLRCVRRGHADSEATTRPASRLRAKHPN
jgi:hypothetical protein